MASLDEMWARFSLMEEEKGGAEVSKEEDEIVHRLAGRFYMKRVLNVDAVARTFKPLWRTAGELKIRDIGEHILLFEFEDVLDLERVMEFEPWSYDKHLVAFERVLDIESVPFLEFSRSTFWVQMHNILERSLKVEVGEMIGKTIGRVIQVADLEDDSAGSEFLRVRINIDISKPLPRASLRKEEQQYGEWLRAEPLRVSRKIVVVVLGSSRSQAPWWRKRDNNKGPSSNYPSNSSSKENADNSKEVHSFAHSAANMVMDYGEVSKPFDGNDGKVNPVMDGGIQCHELTHGLHVKKQAKVLEEVVVGLTLNDKLDECVSETNGECMKMSVGLGVNARKFEVMPMQDCTNQITNSASVGSMRKWKKLAREVGQGVVSPSPMIVDRRPVMDDIDRSVVWNRTTFGHVRSALKRLMVELKEAEEGDCYRTDPGRIQLLRKDIGSLQSREEYDNGVWVEDETDMGGVVEKYFQNIFSTSNPSGFDSILNGIPFPVEVDVDPCLKDDNGVWVEDETDMGGVVEKYFQNIFSTSNPSGFDSILNGIPFPVEVDVDPCLKGDG
nr:hypothetical protein CFP56_61880 [Quercus suber]